MLILFLLSQCSNPHWFATHVTDLTLPTAPDIQLPDGSTQPAIATIHNDDTCHNHNTENTDENNKLENHKSNTDDENIYTSEEDDEHYKNWSRDAYVTLKMDNQSDNNIKPYPKYGYVGDNNESTINREVHQKSQSSNPNHMIITKPHTTRSQLIVGHLGISEKTELHHSLHLHQVLPSHYKKRIKSQLIVRCLGISEKTELHCSLHLHQVLPSHYNKRIEELSNLSNSRGGRYYI